MKKIIFYGILSLSLFLISSKFTKSALAQTKKDSTEAGITASSNFYFLDKFGESIQLVFSPAEEKKAELNLQFAEERLAEADKLLAQNKIQKLEQTLNRYQNQIQNAYEHANKYKNQGEENNKSDDALNKVAESTIKHQEKLSVLYEQVPDAAQKGIQNAMDSSMKGYENSYKALSDNAKDEIDSKTEEIRKNLDKKRSNGVPVPNVPSNPRNKSKHDNASSSSYKSK